jgi:hypothetical protein
VHSALKEMSKESGVSIARVLGFILARIEISYNPATIIVKVKE